MRLPRASRSPNCRAKYASTRLSGGAPDTIENRRLRRDYNNLLSLRKITMCIVVICEWRFHFLSKMALGNIQARREHMGGICNCILRPEYVAPLIRGQNPSYSCPYRRQKGMPTSENSVSCRMKGRRSCLVRTRDFSGRGWIAVRTSETTHNGRRVHLHYFSMVVRCLD